MEAVFETETPKRTFEEVETVYRCGSCGNEFETKSEAKKCCQSWACGRCGCDHETKKEAKDCCGGWVCGWCGESHDSKAEANECCKETE